MTLSAELSLQRGDGSADPIPRTNMLCPTNNILHTMISSLTIKVGQKTINQATDNYPYKAFLSTLLNFGMEAGASHLQSGGWALDRQGRFVNSWHIEADSAIEYDAGQLPRRQFFKNCPSGQNCNNYTTPWLTPQDKVNFQAQLFTDLEMCTAGFPPNAELSVHMKFGQKEFYMLANEEDAVVRPWLKLSNVRLLVPQATMSTEENHIFRGIWAKKPFRLNMRRTQVRTLHVAQGTLNFSQECSYKEDSGLPANLFMCLVKERAGNGQYDLNPFHLVRYEPAYHVTEMAVSVNGELIHKDLSAPATRNCCMTQFNQLMHVLGLSHMNQGAMFDYKGPVL